MNRLEKVILYNFSLVLLNETFKFFFMSIRLIIIEVTYASIVAVIEP